ncbi:MAG TPA: sigma 54-interacting transcriptional regulator, partial [Vicinamibacteria bacterium]|nr:sigma 54-interacting transcriptional regulator [Vicinamibacteria bacterium]
ELFGHEPGAFTGANRSKAGLLEVAHRGTVFLDEIGDMDASIQGKLLKVLEERRFRRLGDVRERLVDIRLIAATHRDLPALCREGRFRSDLYYRLAALPLAVPPLRQRAEDIPGLAAEITSRFASELGRQGVRLSGEAVAALQRHTWPGNLRELRNTLERAVLLTEADVLGPGDLRFFADGGAGTPAAAATLDAVERAHIERVLALEEGHVARAASRLGISASSLYARLRRYGIGRFDR